MTSKVLFCIECGPLALRINGISIIIKYTCCHVHYWSIWAPLHAELWSWKRLKAEPAIGDCSDNWTCSHSNKVRVIWKARVLRHRTPMHTSCSAINPMQPNWVHLLWNWVRCTSAPCCCSASVSWGLSRMPSCPFQFASNVGIWRWTGIRFAHASNPHGLQKYYFQTCINTEIRCAKKNSEFSKGEGIAVLQRSEFQKFFPFRSQEAVHW